MKTTTCTIKDSRFKAATKVLDDWGFIYEMTPNGKLRAEPMDISISDTLIQKLGNAGYFSLPCRGGLMISVLDNNRTIFVNKNE